MSEPENPVRTITDRGVRDPRLLDALRAVPRAGFVPANLAERAYEDNPLPIPHDQVTTQPSLVAKMVDGRGDLGRAVALNKESLSIYSGLGDKSGMALVLINLGEVAREQGDENQAVALYNDALAMYQELGNERGMARALGRLAPRQ